MRSRLDLASAILVLAACTTAHASRDIGVALQPQPSVRYSAVRAQPAAYLGRTVLVEATVDAVCKHAGCWMKIADAGEVAMVHWQTGCGGEYAFPKDAAGRRVLIQGVVRPKSLSEDEALHYDEEAGRKLDLPREVLEIKADAIRLL